QDTPDVIGYRIVDPKVVFFEQPACLLAYLEHRLELLHDIRRTRLKLLVRQRHQPLALLCLLFKTRTRARHICSSVRTEHVENWCRMLQPGWTTQIIDHVVASAVLGQIFA